MKNNAVNQKKLDFALKYSDKNPAFLGRLAAAQRACLYTPNLNHRIVFSYWESLLNKYAEKYRNKRTEEDFIKDCVVIKNEMNQKFEMFFQNGRTADGIENGFRLAHAQKSLSITIKHMWCREELSPKNTKYYPPVCPIDGIILKKVGCNDSWIRVNSVEEYAKHLAIVKKRALKDGYKSLPEWELIMWPTKSKQADSSNAHLKQRMKKEKNAPKGRRTESNLDIMLKVYDGNRTENYGKAFQIINNPLTIPHNTDNVYLDFMGQLYPAAIGTYRGGEKLRGDTLRSRSISELIQHNNWQPGDTFRCESIRQQDGSHLYRILS